MIPRLDLKQVLIGCAQAIDVIDIGKAAGLMHVLEQMVSVSGEPIQRVGAYMLEGLRARLELSGSKIYRALKCDAPISSDLMTYMGILYQICPYWKFAYIFPYVLHHMPDESVDTWNHRDRLLRLVKSLSPKIVTLVEQESNTNTTPFHLRFLETLSYYTAMFESIDVARPRDDRQRISAEQHCVARDIVNVIACEGAERVERHELLGKWRSRFQMAGFSQYPLSSSVTAAVRDVLKDYDRKYRVEERDGGLCLYWLRRAMAASSAWM
ncbi:Scarecrow-like transcription factor PAT1 [Linum perenne]